MSQMRANMMLSQVVALCETLDLKLRSSLELCVFFPAKPGLLL